jgi:ribonuclease P/MRP protein subunit RPP1
MSHGRLQSKIPSCSGRYPFSPNVCIFNICAKCTSDEFAVGYNVLALTHTVTPDSKTGKLPSHISCPIPQTLPFTVPKSTQILRRLTLTLTDHTQNHRLKDLTSPSAGYDILAIRPIDEKTLQAACLSLDCDLLSLDLSTRYHFHFQYKMFAAAIARGVHIELCYGPGIMGSADQRRMLIQNAGALIRVTRGRGLIISSECKDILACRGPADIVNLAAVWGLGQERGIEAVTTEGRKVVMNSSFKRTSYRGVVDVIYGGEKPEKKPAEVQGKEQKGKTDGNNKRKFAEMNVAVEQAKKPLSNRQKKKLEKEAAAAKKQAEATSSGQVSEQDSTQQ